MRKYELTTMNSANVGFPRNSREGIPKKKANSCVCAHACGFHRRRADHDTIRARYGRDETEGCPRGPHERLPKRTGGRIGCQRRATSEAVAGRIVPRCLLIGRGTHRAEHRSPLLRDLDIARHAL